MTSPTLPLLAPWCRVLGDGDRLLFEHARSLVVLEGAAVGSLLPALLPLLDGTRTVDALAARLGPAARPAIDAAIQLLAEHGLVVEGPDAPAERRDAARAAAAGYGLPPAVAAERLATAVVGVVGRGGSRFDVARLLAAAGIGRMRRLGWRGRGRVDAAVVVPAAHELDRLTGWNGAALAAGTPFLVLGPWDGRTAAVGPLVLPGRTCCYECLRLRRAANSAYPDDLAEVEAAPVAVPPDAPVGAMAAALTAHLVVRWLVGRDPGVPGTLFTLDARPEVRLTTHVVLRVPRCPACSSADRVAPPLPWHAAAA